MESVRTLFEMLATAITGIVDIKAAATKACPMYLFLSFSLFLYFSISHSKWREREREWSNAKTEWEAMLVNISPTSIGF